MRFSWRRAVRQMLVVVLAVGAGSAAFGYDRVYNPQSPIESYLIRGQDTGMVMPVSAEAPVGCSAATCGTMADPSCGCNNAGGCGPTCSTGCGSSCDTGCCVDPCCGAALDYFAPGGDNCGCNTVSVGGELLFLKAFSGVIPNDDDYDVGFRFWASWQRPDGLGARIRFFDTFQDGPAPAEFYAIDAEVIDTIQLGCNWTLIAALGIRYQGIDAGPVGFHGLGPVASAELYRTINCNTQVYGISRYSILVDDQALGNFSLATMELQIGLQRTRELANGALAFGRVGWEAQQYDDLVANASTVTLMGGALSLGVYY